MSSPIHRHDDDLVEKKKFAQSSFHVRAFYENRVNINTVRRGYWVKFNPMEARYAKFLNQLVWGGKIVNGLEISSPTLFNNNTFVWAVFANVYDIE